MPVLVRVRHAGVQWRRAIRGWSCCWGDVGAASQTLGRLSEGGRYVKPIDLAGKAKAMSRWLIEHACGLQINADLRVRLSLGCLDAALEYQRAMILLVSRQMYGSSFALARLLLEAYVRGVWLHRCASESELAEIENGREFKKFFQLIEDIEKLDGFDAGVLSKLKELSWKAMNDYTHTGIRQISRRNSEEFIGSNYDEEEVLEVLRFSCALAWMSGIEICLVSNDLEKANEVLQKPVEQWL